MDWTCQNMLTTYIHQEFKKWAFNPQLLSLSACIPPVGATYCGKALTSGPLLLFSSIYSLHHLFFLTHGDHDVLLVPHTITDSFPFHIWWFLYSGWFAGTPCRERYNLLSQQVTNKMRWQRKTQNLSVFLLQNGSSLMRHFLCFQKSWRSFMNFIMQVKSDRRLDFKK